MLGYGIRVCIRGEVEHQKINSEIQQLDEECNKLNKVVEDLEKEAVYKEQKAKEEDDTLDKEHASNVDERKTKITKYKNEIKEVLMSHKSG